jgi:hypothetical protein
VLSSGALGGNRLYRPGFPALVSTPTNATADAPAQKIVDTHVTDGGGDRKCRCGACAGLKCKIKSEKESTLSDKVSRVAQRAADALADLCRGHEEALNAETEPRKRHGDESDLESIEGAQELLRNSLNSEPVVAD